MRAVGHAAVVSRCLSPLRRGQCGSGQQQQLKKLPQTLSADGTAGIRQPWHRICRYRCHRRRKGSRLRLRACRSHRRWSAIRARQDNAYVRAFDVNLCVRLSSLTSAALPRVDQGARLVRCGQIQPCDSPGRIRGSQIQCRDWPAERNSRAPDGQNHQKTAKKEHPHTPLAT